MTCLGLYSGTLCMTIMTLHSLTSWPFSRMLCVMQYLWTLNWNILHWSFHPAMNLSGWFWVNHCLYSQSDSLGSFKDYLCGEILNHLKILTLIVSVSQTEITQLHLSLDKRNTYPEFFFSIWTVAISSPHFEGKTYLSQSCCF